MKVIFNFNMNQLTTHGLRSYRVDLAPPSAAGLWNVPLAPNLIVSREFDVPMGLGTTPRPFSTPIGTAFEKPAPIPPGRIAASAFLRSPAFLWQDAKAAPLVSAGLFAGLGIAAYAGVMDELSPFLLVGGTATASYLTIKGALGLRREANNGDRAATQRAARDFGVGAFGLAVTAATAGIMAGLEHFGILSEQTEERYGGLLRALAALLHSPDEIALGLIAMRGFLGWGRKDAGKESS